MPLNTHPTEEGFKANIRELVKSGRKLKQAIAISISQLAKHPSHKLPKKLRKLVERHKKINERK